MQGVQKMLRGLSLHHQKRVFPIPRSSRGKPPFLRPLKRIKAEPIFRGDRFSDEPKKVSFKGIRKMLRALSTFAYELHHIKKTSLGFFGTYAAFGGFFYLIGTPLQNFLGIFISIGFIFIGLHYLIKFSKFHSAPNEIVELYRESFLIHSILISLNKAEQKFESWERDLRQAFWGGDEISQATKDYFLEWKSKLLDVYKKLLYCLKEGDQRLLKGGEPFLNLLEAIGALEKMMKEPLPDQNQKKIPVE